MAQGGHGAGQLGVGRVELGCASVVAFVQLRVHERHPEEVAESFDDVQLFGIGRRRASQDQLTWCAGQGRDGSRAGPMVAVVLDERTATLLKARCHWLTGRPGDPLLVTLERDVHELAPGDRLHRMGQYVDDFVGIVTVEHEH
ncbi:MAG: hypothetical protein ABWX96_02825 [Propionibacteriaceae bacterium]